MNTRAAERPYRRAEPENRLDAVPEPSASRRPVHSPAKAGPAPEIDRLARDLVHGFRVVPEAEITPLGALMMSDAELSDALNEVRAHAADTPIIHLDYETVQAQLETLEQEAQMRGQTEAPPPREADLHLDEKRPWVVIVDTQDATPAEIAHELYGVPIGPVMPRETFDSGKTLNKIAGHFGLRGGLPEEGNFTVFVNLLRPKYRNTFHAKMRALLARAISRTKSILLYEFPDDDDRDTLFSTLSWWSRQGDIQTEQGGSYFDAYLSALDRGQLSTNWGLFETNRRSYLDELYDVLGDDDTDRSGALTAKIGTHSETFGGHVPLFRLGDEEHEPRDTPNADLVDRATDEILDRMFMNTPEEESRAIREALTGLPPRESAAVIQRIMDHHQDRWFLFVDRFGEPTRDHMLFNLFENLDDEDAVSLAANLVERGMLAPEGADALVEGRSLFGKLAPMTTYIGQEMQQAFQTKYEKEGGWHNATLGGIFGLWTPETAGETFGLIATARLAPGLGGLLAKAPGWMRVGLTVGGVGATLYNLHRNSRAALTGEDENGPLNESQRVTRTIYAMVDVAFLYHGVRNRPRTGRVGDTALARSPTAAPKTQARFNGMVSDEMPYLVQATDGQGNVLAFGRNALGEELVMRVNMRTGEGTLQIGRGAPMKIQNYTVEPPPDIAHPVVGEPAALPPGGQVDMGRQAALLPGTQQPGLPRTWTDAEIDKMAGDLGNPEGGYRIPAFIKDLFFYYQQPTAKKAIMKERARLGTSGLRVGVSRKLPSGAAVHPDPALQAAHVSPQAAFRGNAVINPRRLVTRFLPTGKGHQHTTFDDHWLASFRQIRAQTGRDTTTANELYEVVTDALRHSGAFDPGEAEALRLLLADELFGALGLAPEHVLPMPK